MASMLHGWLSKLWSLFGCPKYQVCRIIVGIQKGTIILTTTHMFEVEFDKRLTIIRQLRLRGTGIWKFLLLLVLTGMGLALGLSSG